MATTATTATGSTATLVRDAEDVAVGDVLANGRRVRHVADNAFRPHGTVLGLDSGEVLALHRHEPVRLLDLADYDNGRDYR